MNINGIGTDTPLTPKAAPSSIGGAIGKNSSTFADMLNSMIEETNSAQIRGEQAISDLQAGRAEHLHEVMIRMEEADLSIRTLTQVRNRVKSAYDKIMQLQI